eukprot:6556866-Prymnesium_polylepis.1
MPPRCVAPRNPRRSVFAVSTRWRDRAPRTWSLRRRDSPTGPAGSAVEHPARARCSRRGRWPPPRERKHSTKSDVTEDVSRTGPAWHGARC